MRLTEVDHLVQLFFGSIVAYELYYSTQLVAYSCAIYPPDNQPLYLLFATVNYNTNMTLYTIGHSTREIDEFVTILKHYGIKQLVDVRSIPMSRYTPQFNHDRIDKSLSEHDISYTQLKLLGGRRSTRKDSPNTAWRNKSFRGYADYMQTDDFATGIDNLIKLAEQEPTAIMCAEAVPWRCHRSMIGDAMLVRGYDVIDIFDERTAKDETLTSFAKVDGTMISYPG